jgi:hypothetical protein
MDLESPQESPQWNEALEKVIQKEGEQAEGLYWLHTHAAQWASRRNDLIQLPAICLATITGFLSATSDLLPPIAVGALSVGVGILNTINSYFKYSQRAEGHRITGLLYLKTYKEIETQLSIPISQRTPAEVMLKQLREELQRVSETAPQLPTISLDAFKKKFKGTDVAVPIVANGLDKIQILERPPSTPRTPKTPMPNPRPQIKIVI